MKNQKLKFATILVPSAFMLLQACHTHKENEPDPMFAEKKRPQYNQVLLNQKPNENEYQEVNASFISDYKARKENQANDMFMSSSAKESSMDAVQRLRNEAAKYNYRLVPMQDYVAPVEPVAPKEPEPRYTPAQNSKIYENETYEPEAPENVAPVVSSSAAGETFEIQAGAYNSEAGAMRIVQKLETKGIANVRIENKEGRYTVRINNDGKPFKTRDEASKTLQNIIEKTQHYDIMVVKNKM